MNEIESNWHTKYFHEYKRLVIEFEEEKQRWQRQLRFQLVENAQLHKELDRLRHPVENLLDKE